VRALDLAENIPTVRRETTGAEAARVLAEYRFPGLVVADATGIPTAVIPGSQLLGLILPRYVRDDPTLAHAYDEAGAEELCRLLNTTTIGELLDSRRLQGTKPPSVLPEDTLIEIASVMVEERHPLILVRDRDGTYRGTILMSRVIAAVAEAAGQSSPRMRVRLEQDLLDGEDRG